MTILPISITGDPVLHTPALEVQEITDEVLTLISDMFETMEKAPGVGLAAPQVGVAMRIFVFDYEVDDVRFRDVAINPKLSIEEFDPANPDEELEIEGCLSIPGERFPLKRSPAVTLSALDANGHPYEIVAEGWLARIFQHEFDHLEGILYSDRLIEPYGSEMQALIEELGWGGEGLSWMPGQDYLEP